MNDRGHTRAGSPAGDTRRPLWPWAVGALVLCLFAAGFSFWWPMYRVNELVKSIRDRGGEVDYNNPSIKWRTVFGEQLHPSFHEVTKVELLENRVSDRELRTITKLRGVRSLALDLSDNSPQVIRDLGHLQEVSFLQIQGDGGPVPLDWIEALPNLSLLRIENIEISEDSWESVVLSPIAHLSISNCPLETKPTPNSTLRGIELRGIRLAEAHGKALQNINFEELSLTECTATSGFWSSLSKHESLQKLRLESMDVNRQTLVSIVEMHSLNTLAFTGASSPSRRLNRGELEVLSRLKTLEELDFNGYELPDDDCWKTVAQLPRLKCLTIQNCPVGDATAYELATSSTVNTLTLNSTDVTDAGLMMLVRMPSLKLVFIRNTSVTDESAERFSRTRPDVDLYR